MRSVREIEQAIEEMRPAAEEGDPYAQGVVQMLGWVLGDEGADLAADDGE